MLPTNFLRRSSNKDVPLLPLHASHYTPDSPYSDTSHFSEEDPSTMIEIPIPSSEPLLALSRQSSHLRSHLQTLLDAQSEGLVAGLGSGPSDSVTSASSDRTPTTAASDNNLARSQRTLPVRQPKPRKISLRAARRGISSTMGKLSQVKATEAELLTSDISSRENALSSVDLLTNRTIGLRAEIERIESEPSNIRIKDLKQGEKTLDCEIHELETRLYEMKARQRHMLREISSLESRVQSKLSSYKSSLELAEEDAREFLARPLIDIEPWRSAKRGLWALPPARRTLELVREQWMEEQQTLDRDLKSVVKEKTAFDEGAGVWEDVVKEVSDIERLLQKEMSKLNRPSESADEAASGMQRVLKGLRMTEKSLAAHLETSQEREWKPLICCVGAELEALAGARSMLYGIFEASRGSYGSLTRENSGLESRSEDEDNEPGPELLVEHYDT